ncbi:hypothetical protein BJX99DRAFT_239669 [Aspergillus californicus]
MQALNRPLPAQPFSTLYTYQPNMPHTTYDGTIAVAQKILKSLRHILHLAETQQPEASSTTLLTARLHPDMYPLPDQIRLATQFCENLAARLSGREPETFERESLNSFAGFYARIDKVLQILEQTDKDVVNEQGDKVVPTPFGPGVVVDLSGAQFAHTAAIPNIYFHLTTAYGILRKEGVVLGKKDYYAGFISV